MRRESTDCNKVMVLGFYGEKERRYTSLHIYIETEVFSHTVSALFVTDVQQ